MREGRFRHLPVLHRGHLVGIVSDRDIASSREGNTIADIMRRDVITVAPDTPIEVAARLMLDNKIGALPVIADGTDAPAGIVSQTDLFEVLAQLLGGEGPSSRLELRLDDLPLQLASVTALAHERNVPITSLVTLPAGSDETSRRVVLRIGTIVRAPFARALRDAGIDVDPGAAARPESLAGADV